MSDLIQSLPSPSAYSGGITHTWLGESWMVDVEALVMMMAMISSNSPVPAGCQNGVSGPRNRVSRGGGAADFFLENLRTLRKFHGTRVL